MLNIKSKIHWSFLIFLGGSYIPAMAEDFIAPPMVNIPSGSFIMGSNSGADYAKPAHAVEVSAFQMAKYPVTIAEFRKFAKDTNFSPKANCKDNLSKNWLSSPDSKGSARWDDHRYIKNEYQPVTCINWQDAMAYANWLSKKTGIDYRLPTEKEWDYALKANTTSRFFWGDDPDLTQACRYGNFADQTGEHVPSKTFGASYVGFGEYTNCNDGEPYVSIVGLYRPNPFGLHEMAGNVLQYLGSCYYDGHQARTEEEMDINTCEYIAQSGSSWHGTPIHFAERGSWKKEGWNPGALVGFRLAVDGHSDILHPSSLLFENELSSAKEDHLKNRQALLQPPHKIHLVKKNKGTYTLRWQRSESTNVKEYDIYQSKIPYAHFLGGYYQDHYQKITSVSADSNEFDVKLDNQASSFRIVSVGQHDFSLPSEVIYIENSKEIEIPGRLKVKENSNLENLHMKRREETEDKPEMYYLSKIDEGFQQTLSSISFKVNVKKSGWYLLNYAGGSNQKGEFFKVWQNDNMVSSISFDPNEDDKKSKRHKVYLKQGKSDVQLTFQREGWDRWYLAWVELTELPKSSIK